VASKPKTKKAVVTEFETLNSPTAAAAEPPASVDSDEEESDLPTLTPSLEGFSRIPVGQYLQSFEYIQKHRDVVVDGASDALLVAGFTAENAGQYKYAKQCVNQSLLLQYGEKLGKDGIGIFFKKLVLCLYRNILLTPASG
jgi:cell division cycle protein 37